MNPECPVTLRAIVHAVAQARGIPERHIYSRRRDKPISEARQIVYWLARELPGLSSTVAGRLLGDRDHVTILTGAKVIEGRRLVEPALAAELEGFKAELSGSARAQLTSMLADPDPVAVASRIAHSLDPVRAGLRISALETAAMAVRLVDLDDIAAATFQLLARCERALALTGDDAAEHAAGTRDLIEALESALDALGYSPETTEPELSHEHIAANA